MSSNWRNWFLRSVRNRELDETLNLYRRIDCVRAKTRFADEERLDQFIIDLIFDICERRGVTPSRPLAAALFQTINDLLLFDGLLVELPQEAALPRFTLEESVTLRATWRRHLRFVEDEERLLSLWREKVAWVFTGTLSYLPLSAFTDIDENGTAADDSLVLPEAKAYALCDNLPEVLDRLLITFYDADVRNAGLFDALRERFDTNALTASGIPHGRLDTATKLRLPSEHVNQSAESLIQGYLQGTPFQEFFASPLPFAIPFAARFEHTHVIGGTGHGKTQLLQFLINHDLTRALDDGRSVVVIDSQGDLIKTTSQLSYFSPSASKNLADRFVFIDPNDIQHPACLNMFDFKRDRLSGYAPVDREKILNATVELYEYFFGALLGAELTQRQGLIFKYLARLLIEIPNATIHTLRELMEDGERFRPHMEKLSGTTRSFFATRFFDRSFNETKKQVLTRLWGVLANSSLERMFSHTENKIDIFELLNQGKIIFINTAKDLLGQEGSAIFGRFFIALIAQAAVQRAAMPAHARNPSFVYIDEAEEYFDDNISNLLTQVRKYRIGLIFAHQNLDQLPAGLRASVLANTSIKFAGGVSARDAHALGSELRCNSQFLLSQKKGQGFTEFGCYVRNYTGKALSVRIPLGYVESLPVLDKEEWDILLAENQSRYSAPPFIPETPSARTAGPHKAPERPPEPRVALVEQAPIASLIEDNARPQSPERQLTASARAPETKRTPRAPRAAVVQGRGGQQHKYLQHLIKQLAEERGFRASIEESILSGAGRADVSLARGERRIACEISVTTSRDQELANVEKCLAAGYAEVVVVGATERHVKSLAKFIGENLEEGQGTKVRYATAETLVEYLDSLRGPPAPEEKVVRGYKVRTVQQLVDPKEAEARRKAIAEVVARSLAKQHKQ